MNIGLVTQELHSNFGREETLEQLSTLQGQADNLYLQTAQGIREVPKQATHKSFYQEINKQLDTYARSIDAYLDSKELIEWKWNDKAAHIDQAIKQVQAQADTYISDWVEKHFPVVDPAPQLHVTYMDKSVKQFSDAPEQVVARYQPPTDSFKQELPAIIYENSVPELLGVTR